MAGVELVQEAKMAMAESVWAAMTAMMELVDSEKTGMTAAEAVVKRRGARRCTAFLIHQTAACHQVPD